MKSLGRRLFGFSLLPGGHGGGVTPVSIPNTEVKYTSGEGTAGVARGRVARRQAFFQGARMNGMFMRAFFLFTTQKLNNVFCVEAKNMVHSVTWQTNCSHIMGIYFDKPLMVHSLTYVSYQPIMEMF